MIWRWSVIGMNMMNKNVKMKGYSANNVPCRYFINFLSIIIKPYAACPFHQLTMSRVFTI